jgi:hypothetical protein
MKLFPVLNVRTVTLSFGTVDRLLCGTSSRDRVVGHSEVINRDSIMMEDKLEISLKLYRSVYSYLHLTAGGRGGGPFILILA